MNWFKLYGRFCVGDKFYLCDNKILCEYDYEERVMMASLEYPNKRSALMPQVLLTRCHLKIINQVGMFRYYY